MAFRSRTRVWLDAASTAALGELRAEVERLAAEVRTLRSRGEACEAQQQRDEDALRADLSALAIRFEACTDREYATMADLAQVERRLEGHDVTVEQIRLALAGLAAQSRWESDDLRNALAAIIERVERQRKPV